MFLQTEVRTQRASPETGRSTEENRQENLTMLLCNTSEEQPVQVGREGQTVPKGESEGVGEATDNSPAALVLRKCTLRAEVLPGAE